MLPGVMTPVPPVNTPVRVVLVPSTMEAEAAVKLVMEATGIAGVDEPPQPVKPAKARLTAAVNEARTRDFFMRNSSANDLSSFSACP
jgi:hypothetical protein